MTVKHTFTSAIADDPTAAAAGQVLPSHWNAEHTIATPLTVEPSAATGSALVLKEGSNNGANTITVQAPASLAANYTLTLPVDDGTASQVLQTDGSGVLTWATVAANPGGSDTQVQFNNSGSFGGSSSLTWNGTSLALPSVSLTGNVSAAAWTTGGIGLKVTSRTLTDTSSSGTVSAAYTNVLGGNTIAASSATVYSRYGSLYLGSPTAGTNVTITNGYSLITAGAADFGGNVTAPNLANGKSMGVFTPLDNQPPASNFATLDTRNSIAVLDFDAATDESAVFVGVIPQAATLTSGIVVRIFWMATSATSGNCVWGAQFERYGTDNDSDSFDTAVTTTTAASSTSGIAVVTEITVTTIDSLVAGDQFRLKVYRDADNASDTMTGDAELVAVEVRAA